MIPQMFPQQSDNQYIEDPVQIIYKNLYEKHWFVHTDGDNNLKKLINFNSMELLEFLELNDKEGKIDKFTIQDYTSDMYFNPKTLLENLRETLGQLRSKMTSQMNFGKPFVCPAINLNVNFHTNNYNVKNLVIDEDKKKKVKTNNNNNNQQNQNNNNSNTNTSNHQNNSNTNNVNNNRGGYRKPSFKNNY